MVRLASAFVAALGMAAMPAHAQTVGSVTSIEGQLGDVIIVRGGKTYSLQAGNNLFPGDQIIARNGASVNLDFPGCPLALSPNSSVSIPDAPCEAQPVELTSATEQAALEQAEMMVDPTEAVVEGAAAGESAGAVAAAGAGSTIPVTLAVGAAVVGGVAAAGGGGGDDNNNQPSSP